MDSVYAWRLGEALSEARKSPAGDYIDSGWALIKALHAKGFDVIPREPIRPDRRKTLNEMCALSTPPAGAATLNEGEKP